MQKLNKKISIKENNILKSTNSKYINKINLNNKSKSTDYNYIETYICTKESTINNETLNSIYAKNYPTIYQSVDLTKFKYNGNNIPSEQNLFNPLKNKIVKSNVSNNKKYSRILKTNNDYCNKNIKILLNLNNEKSYLNLDSIVNLNKKILCITSSINKENKYNLKNAISLQEIQKQDKITINKEELYSKINNNLKSLFNKTKSNIKKLENKFTDYNYKCSNNNNNIKNTNNIFSTKDIEKKIEILGKTSNDKRNKINYKDLLQKMKQIKFASNITKNLNEKIKFKSNNYNLINIDTLKNKTNFDSTNSLKKNYDNINCSFSKENCKSKYNKYLRRFKKLKKKALNKDNCIILLDKKNINKNKKSNKSSNKNSFGNSIENFQSIKTNDNTEIIKKSSRLKLIRNTLNNKHLYMNDKLKLINKNSCNFDANTEKSLKSFCILDGISNSNNKISRYFINKDYRINYNLKKLSLDKFNLNSQSICNNINKKTINNNCLENDYSKN